MVFGPVDMEMMMTQDTIPRSLPGSFSTERALKYIIDFLESVPDDALTEDEIAQREIAIADANFMLAALDVT